VFKEKYNLVLMNRAPHLGKTAAGEKDEKPSMSRFKRLFGQSDKYASSAAAKVIHSKNSALRKLWWAVVDKENMQQLIGDIAHFVQRLPGLLNLSRQAQMQKSIDLLLHYATERYNDVPDLEYLRELAVRARYDSPGYDRSEGEGLAEEVERKFRNLLFHSIRKGEIKEVESL
jgi:flavin-binding protein dodecin